jgi:hypothetical protein
MQQQQQQQQQHQLQRQIPDRFVLLGRLRGVSY